MRSCPVCEKKIEKDVCLDCGFDLSLDYENYPTMVRIPKTVKSIQGLRTERRQKHFSGSCRCCGRYFSGDSCLFCGFPAIDDDNPDHQEHIKHLAKMYHARIVEELTDFSICCFQEKRTK